MDTSSSLQSQPITPPKWLERSDLRKRPIYKDRAYHYTYVSPTAPSQKTTGLEPKTQKRFISAAHFAWENNFAINTLFSVRWTSLLTYDDLHPLRTMKTPERIRHLVERFRHWLTERGIPAAYIWVREALGMADEHWHLGFHLPVNKRKAFVGYLEGQLIEPLAPYTRAKSEQTRGEFACSEMGSWHLAGEVPDGKPQFTGFWIAAYLGKGEPSQRMFRGKLVNTKLKPIRGCEFGGTIKDSRYDVPQGLIEGTSTRKGRFDIARCLK